ncbi:hypothetical protein DM01DRAFT_326031 [Hesseltinella vesiculosa]|uniref:Uncharacterized protein n=1 Tax=Hesseltinella vesiculosa TaxID=101127 RepID=A0A1X2GUI1_9FUNG|nr:hypothetical protein DM01DRAFT_326031 [Hesseltinella vesiculosa]
MSHYDPCAFCFCPLHGSDTTPTQTSPSPIGTASTPNASTKWRKAPHVPTPAEKVTIVCLGMARLVVERSVAKLMAWPTICEN